MLQHVPLNVRSALSPEILAQGSAHVVDLEPLRRSPKVNWAVQRTAIQGQFDSLLRKRLSPEHFFAPLEDSKFVVVAPGQESAVAAEQCIGLVRELLLSTTGECNENYFKISVARGGGEGILNTTPLDPGYIRSILPKAESVTHESVPDISPDHSSQVIVAREGVFEVFYRYEPVWDARRQAITTYVCNIAAVYRKEKERELIGISDLPFKIRTTISLSVLTAGITELSNCLKVGERFLLGLPLSFDLLGSPHVRMEVAGRFRDLSSILRQYLAFFITDLPDGVAPSRLTDLMMVLKPFGRVFASVPLGCRTTHPYLCPGLTGVTLDVNAPGLHPERIKSDVVHLAAMARNFRLTSALFGVKTKEVLKQGIAADIQMYSGSAIARSLPHPKSMTHYSHDIVMPSLVTAGEEEWF